MTHEISIRELQRNAGAVLSRTEKGESYRVTRRGRTVGRILPPDPADEAISAAIDAGILDADAMSRARTAAEVATIKRSAAPSRDRSISAAIDDLRADER